MDKKFIYIFKGDDTNWNNEQFLTVNVTSDTADLSTMTAKFILGSYTEEYPLTTGSFQIDLNAATTGDFAFGPICGIIQILDSEGRIKTACNTIPFFVTDKVITEQAEEINVPLPEGSPVNIDLFVGENLDYNSLRNLPTLNGVTIQGDKTSVDYGLANSSDIVNLQEQIDGKQPVGDYATHTDLSQGLATKQDIIADLAQIRSNAELGATAVQPATLASELATKQDKLNSSQLAAVNSGIDSSKTAQIATNATEINSIQSKIPSQASASNQLADKNFVNSSIATNTANFLGTFNSVQELPSTATNNDYAFVISTDTVGNVVYNRYKFNGTTWLFEYALNNSSFTAAQWAAIQSGITTALVEQITNNQNNIGTLSSLTTDTKANLVSAVNELNTDKQKKLTPGSNIQIDDLGYICTISATDTTYTAGTGIEITAGNVINNTQDLSGYLQNTATGNNSLSILGPATSSSGATNIGVNAEVTGQAGVCIGAGIAADQSVCIGGLRNTYKGRAALGAVAVGYYGYAIGSYSIAIGRDTHANSSKAITIGSSATSSADSAIQIGAGTNSNANTFQVFNTRVVNDNGKITSENLDTIDGGNANA